MVGGHDDDRITVHIPFVFTFIPFFHSGGMDGGGREARNMAVLQGTSPSSLAFIQHSLKSTRARLERVCLYVPTPLYLSFLEWDGLV